jgi:hypothetical protein
MFQGYTDFTMTARKYYKFWPFCIKTFTLGVKWKAKQKYNTIRTIPKSYWKLIERGKLDTPNTQITDRLLSLFDTGNSIKRWGSKKIYKIPESVNRGRTDNTVTKRKKDKQRWQNVTKKTKDRATRTYYKPGCTQVLQKGKQFLLHAWHPSFWNHLL